jgi:hypothetical protein
LVGPKERSTRRKCFDVGGKKKHLSCGPHPHCYIISLSANSGHKSQGGIKSTRGYEENFSVLHSLNFSYLIFSCALEDAT